MKIFIWQIPALTVRGKTGSIVVVANTLQEAKEAANDGGVGWPDIMSTPYTVVDLVDLNKPVVFITPATAG